MSITALLSLFLFFTACTMTSSAQAQTDSCQRKCGDIDIPYPFGMGDGCYATDYPGNFSINCTDNSKAYLPNGNIEVIDIFLGGELRIKAFTGYECFDQGRETDSFLPWVNLADPFTFSHSRNKLAIVGCDTFGFIFGEEGVNYTSGCISYCNDNSFNGVPGDNCSGLGCCEVSIARGLKSFNTSLGSFDNYTTIKNLTHCGYIFLAQEGAYSFSEGDLHLDRLRNQTLPLVLDWSIGIMTCAEAKNNSSTVPYACRSENSACVESNNGVGYRCNCVQGYEGNPYLLGGCKDIDECEGNSNDCKSKETCANIPGAYICNCRPGYKKNREGECESTSSALSRGQKLGLGIGVGLVILLAAGSLTSWGRQRRHLMVQTQKIAEFRQRMFEQNGGPLLQQQISAQPGNSFRIFTEEELAKATEGFSDEQIIGRGGHGVVYLGKLEDNTSVAIKKAKTMDEREGKEFAREMAILSQINHVNVVKILGCCVEVEVPMLVYEFVPGGTLFNLIHGQKGKKPISFWLSLRIAQEVAEALAYLHSYASPPVLHKDVKTSNVLLDENSKVKISDFGASCIAPTDENEMATLVQGTCGYLDPEYLQTYQFTDKSDVYSFGVVLVELLTRRKPFQLLGPENQKGLAMTFISFLNQGKLENILDPQIVEEANAQTLRGISELASRCLCLKRSDRPTMKEVSMTLQILGSNCEHPWNPEHTPEEAKSLLDHDLWMASDSVEVPDISMASGSVGTNYHPIHEVESGR